MLSLIPAAIILIGILKADIDVKDIDFSVEPNHEQTAQMTFNALANRHVHLVKYDCCKQSIYRNVFKHHPG